MKEIDVRQALHDSEIKSILEADPSSLVLDELAVIHGDCRIDVAVVNGRLHGYELKSAKDTLERLPVQQAAYSKVFDCVTLVAAEKHHIRALPLIPEWWGLLVAVEKDGATKLEKVRCANENPCGDSYSIAQLLWRDEVADILLSRGFTAIRSKSKPVLWQIFAEYTDLEDLKSAVRTKLKSRQLWRAAQQQMQYGDS